MDIDRPTPGDREVLVKVFVTTVNRTDCGFRAAKPWIVRFFSGLIRPRARVLGTEFAGVVEAVGRDVESFGVGDRVFGFSEPRFGAHAEYLVIREDGAIATIPDGQTFDEAAANTEGSHYALAIVRAAGIGSGDSVLVNGATGAIGSAAVQLLKGLDASVTAVCGTEHIELVRRLGAGRVIDYTVEDFTMDQERFDVVLDAVGKSSFGRVKHLLKPRGIYLSTDLGPLSMNPLLALITPLFGRKRVMFPVGGKFDRGMATYLREQVESGVFRPVIDRTYPLDRIVEAYRYVETGGKVGNVLIRVAP